LYFIISLSNHKLGKLCKFIGLNVWNVHYCDWFVCLFVCASHLGNRSF